MELTDYIKLYKPFGLSDNDIVYEYLKNEVNHIEFSKMYINLLVEKEEENKALSSFMQEMMFTLTAEKFNPNYTTKEDTFIRYLISQYIQIGDFRYSKEELEEQVSKMECPTWCLVDVITHLHKKYNVYFKGEKPKDNEFYMYSSFREIMDKRNREYENQTKAIKGE